VFNPYGFPLSSRFYPCLLPARIGRLVSPDASRYTAVASVLPSAPLRFAYRGLRPATRKVLPCPFSLGCEGCAFLSKTGCGNSVVKVHEGVWRNASPYSRGKRRFITIAGEKFFSLFPCDFRHRKFYSFELKTYHVHLIAVGNRVCRGKRKVFST
jgi:hypothetical protein